MGKVGRGEQLILVLLTYVKLLCLLFEGANLEVGKDNCSRAIKKNYVIGKEGSLDE